MTQTPPTLDLTADLARLNSATKYPSISTYHGMGDRGKLTEDRIAFDGRVFVTEKVDGTNARIIVLPDGDYFIGSREELLYAKGDRIGNPALGIVEHLRPIADRVAAYIASALAGPIFVIYGEVYGGNVTSASRQYTGSKAVGFRVFDIMLMPQPELRELLAWELRHISLWREQGNQPFVSEFMLGELAAQFGLITVPRLDLLGRHDGADLPQNHADTLAWLREILPTSVAALDEDAGLRPEGVVIRSADRSTIAKIRYEDYERTLRAK